MLVKQPQLDGSLLIALYTQILLDWMPAEQKKIWADIEHIYEI